MFPLNHFSQHRKGEPNLIFSSLLVHATVADTRDQEAVLWELVANSLKLLIGDR